MTTNPEIPQPLWSLLKRSSRSFYLSLAVLPGALRGPVGLAYLLARTADTIADTRVLPPADRWRQLAVVRGALDVPQTPRLREIGEALQGGRSVAWERELLARLPECHALLWQAEEGDRERIRGLLHLLLQGMQRELELFPAEETGRLVALQTTEDLLQHAYYAAGCVGEFWTGMAAAHCPGLRHWDVPRLARQGVRFGQGLQLTNILRDLPRDLRIGRCYLPRQELARLGLAPEDLLDPAALPSLQPLLQELIRLTLDCYADGRAYTLAVPRREFRMRLACAWPLLIGLATLARIRWEPGLLNPAAPIKIRRTEVYGILGRSTALAWWDGGFTRYWQSLEAKTRSGEFKTDNRQVKTDQFPS
ncbi:MAG: squalene/phytoene synthase family protein [candidate division NC10 bacterium]|nr:squalene/phytoene synthase family protein [candidate division NC10 bacterium]